MLSFNERKLYRDYLQFIQKQSEVEEEQERLMMLEERRVKRD
jgi:hypothetical protein